MSRPILPGATLGVLGGGQLGRMFAIAARRMGYRVHVLAPEDDTPTGQVADREIRSAYDDPDALTRFARDVAVMTFEFENVPAVAAEIVGRHVPVRPGGAVLHTTQNRLREKALLRRLGVPHAAFEAVHSLADLETALRTLGTPAILKSADWGYDGKGQQRIAAPDQATAAWGRTTGSPAVLEAVVDFACELSVIAARGIDGTMVLYGPMRNDHDRHILDVAGTPAGLPATVASAAHDLARTLVEALDVVGVLCVEMFLDRDGGLLVNELAPRPHNSGHLTIDAHVTCQFEQQVRAVCGLPLGDGTLLRPAAMANLLGDLWADGEPDWAALCAQPDIKLHLYGKSAPRPGRKMGHITALADSAAAAVDRVRAARRALRPRA